MKEIDVKQIYARIEYHLFDAQSSYESAIQNYGKFRDQWIDEKVDYEKLFAETVRNIASTGEKVTIIKEIAKTKCIDEYRKMLHTETRYKYYKKLCEGLNERIQTIKYLGRAKHSNFN